MQTAQINSVLENTSDKQLFLKLLENGTKKIAKIDSDFNKSFSFKVAIADSDSVNINDKEITSDSKRVKNISVVIDSETAKETILNKYGIDLNKVATEIKNNKNYSDFAMLSLNNLFKKVAKNL